MRAAKLVLVVATLVSGCARDAQPAASAPATTPIEVLGHGPRISMARIRLGPGEKLGLRASRCQDISIFVEKGTARLSVDDAAALEQGRAMRVSAPATLEADPAQGAALFAVAVLSAASSEEAVDWNHAPSEDACPVPETTRVVSQPNRSGPFMHAGGRLAVMIYLDAYESARPVPSLGTLSGDETLGVPEHTHEESAEVLWIQDGSGTMRVGDETRPIHPGTFVYVPPETIHGFEPDGTRPLFAYQVYTPAGPEQRFRNTAP